MEIVSRGISVGNRPVPRDVIIILPVSDFFRISPCVAMETETAGSILCGVVTLAFYSQT